MATFCVIYNPHKRKAFATSAHQPSNVHQHGLGDHYKPTSKGGLAHEVEEAAEKVCDPHFCGCFTREPFPFCACFALVVVCVDDHWKAFHCLSREGHGKRETVIAN